MLQQVMTAPGVIEFREVPIPEPKAGEVLVKIMRIGVCGSDIHVYHGEHPFTKYPVTQGHEVSGEIAALGKGVTSLRVGQRVTIGGMRQVLPLPPWQIQSLRGTQGDGVPDHWYRQRIFCGGCG